MKTLKREEIYANRYEDLRHMRVNIAEFIEHIRSAAEALGVGLSFSRGIRTASCVARASGELRERNASVLRAMTNMLGKFSREGGDVAPFPRSPSSAGGGKKFKRRKCVHRKLSHPRGASGEYGSDSGPISRGERLLRVRPTTARRAVFSSGYRLTVSTIFFW